jgi:hypothetical protein
MRLGSVAADLARIASFAEIPANAAVESLMDESKAFIEWTAPDLDIDTAARLVEIQRGLARWHFAWPGVQNEADQRRKLAEQARAWSDQVLDWSGLLNGE